MAKEKQEHVTFTKEEKMKAMNIGSFGCTGCGCIPPALTAGVILLIVYIF
ncbi:hypothetical protein [Alkalihalobacterium chitinilyticum]|uniref:Bacteriocin n=1 Tax=Alkalihalobacterium chitinilyticum TaxID=2980103 RepID=A0ABT5VK70_9BACI|nr:hypothetical protein [Alkalihalobacterium chitinilyticum]MDE5415606.1 hypothetical protein [Alkalihalobacterium chitinilyticum]